MKKRNKNEFSLNEDLANLFSGKKEDKMVKKTIIVFVIFVLMVSFSLYSAPIMESRDHMRYRGFRKHMVEKNLFPVRQLLRFKDEIGLTADQISKIEKMQVVHQEYVVKKHAEIKVSEIKFEAYLKQDKISRSTVAKMIQEIGKQRTDLLVDNINYLLDVKEILTPEQIEKIEDLKKDIRMRHFRRGEGRKNQR